MALEVETGLFVVAFVLPAPPSALVRLGDSAISNCAARRSSALGTLLVFWPLTAADGPSVGGATDNMAAVAAALAGEAGNMDAVADGTAAMGGEEV